MKRFYTIILVLVTTASCVSCGNINKKISEKINEKSTSTSNSNNIFSPDDLKADAYSDEYRLNAEFYRDKFYEDNTDMISYNEAIENYTKSIDVLMESGVDTTLFYDDLYKRYNNMGMMQMRRWGINKDDVTLLDPAIENFNTALQFCTEENTDGIRIVNKNLGIAYHEKWDSNYADAELKELVFKHYETAYAIDPDNANINNFLGIYYIDVWENYGYNEEDYNLAEQYLQRAIELDSDYEGAYTNLSYLYEKKAEYDVSDTE